MEHSPEEDIITEVTLSINEDGEFFDRPTSSESLSLPDLTTDSSRPSSGSSVSVPIQYRKACGGKFDVFILEDLVDGTTDFRNYGRDEIMTNHELASQGNLRLSCKEITCN
ncbi:hypothetical protein Pmani_004280 [Petrolisthes manimaculis]|uniref:Uncharacterized protein n=1 Tax=Petrolisthes manimaculis TaxID=1843537 RepID=A0AAE1QEE5_9EUCA|nr:hypothetical protein Pmani_004280 [Petrolisthes manimaculis]